MMPSEGEEFLEKILPPRLEDAGLEDCALPPDAIKEAFLKAATAVRSFISLSDDDDDCLNDPWPTTEDSSDMLLGIDEGADSPQSSCSVVKGGDLGSGDKVAVIGAHDDDEGESVDDVVVPGVVEEGESCVDGMRGLKIADNNKENKFKGKSDGNEDEENNEKEKPILAQGFV